MESRQLRPSNYVGIARHSAHPPEDSTANATSPDGYQDSIGLLMVDQLRLRISKATFPAPHLLTPSALSGYAATRRQRQPFIK